MSGTFAAASGSVAKCWIIEATIGNIETMAKMGRNAADTRVTPWGRIVSLPKNRDTGFMLLPTALWIGAY
ncbi:hypothetical protein GCM10017612_38900 [Novosphingobium resinovorum]|nr:hypothetical protein GCM10017612_38900 [Novosphingobium resinovorum]